MRFHFHRFHISLKPVYQFFAPTDGFAESVVVVSLTSVIVLAFLGKLTDSYAAALTAIGGFGVIHDNCSAWLAAKLAAANGSSATPPAPPTPPASGS